MESKRWFTSRTLWVNLLAAVALIVQYATGYEVFDIEAQATILAFINLVLRVVTGKSLSLRKD